MPDYPVLSTIGSPTSRNTAAGAVLAAPIEGAGHRVTLLPQVSLVSDGDPEHGSPKASISTGFAGTTQRKRTLISQHLSEFALHARAFLGLPIPNITFHGPSASTALLVAGDSDKVEFSGLSEALARPGTDLKLFGKPEVKGQRRMGVALARAGTVEDAVELSKQVAHAVRVSL